ncbi:MAG: AAA family ATPase, partial [Deltaproteobacteria bacterium]|nr:AAA family ATPase [Deltaproteobacteria bacterium]
MIIGLTGKNGAGKGEVVKFLAESGYATHSLSDILRDELKTRKHAVTRENLITMGNELRATYGASVLAERTLKRLPLEANAVIDSIRNPFEVEALRQRDDFFLIAVIADPKVRFERTKQRARENDPTTFEQFLEVEARETTSSDPKVQQLDKTETLADAKVPNNRTIEELRQHARKVVNQLSAKLERPDWDQYFMGIARVAALRSNCIKRRVAAVIVRDQRVISTGYNGT